jgi:diaminohydroxyphosphoribosylaminopyrimidine deaminase / 5-amino-6-(5-phosphoribosylamino)uracil reductase
MMLAMRRAQQWSEAALVLSQPNPRVGCVITDREGEILGEGFTQPAGQAHAEVMALRDVASRGHSAKGAVAWVTLEPCAHVGRTPPCCEALIAAGISKVYVAQLDPNPLVAGRGVQRMHQAGMEVTVLAQDHPSALASKQLNIGFFSRMVRGLPWVRMKMAASLDGTTALANGQSQWITSAAAREDGQRYRARACAVLTGIGTVLADDPLLNVRALIDSPRGRVPTPRQPHAVVVDSELNIATSAKILRTLGQRGQASAAYAQKMVDAIAPRSVLIYHACRDEEKMGRLRALGLELTFVPDAGSGQVDLAAMLRHLASKWQVNELHVEAGHRLSGSFMRAGLVDECLLYLAPKFLGAGIGLAQLPALAQLSDLPKAQELVFESVDLIGSKTDENLRIVARVRGREAF